MNEALALAEKVVEGPPIAIRLAQQMMYRGLEMDLQPALKMAAAAEAITLSSVDHEEGVATLRKRRQPRFKGV